MAVGVVWAAGGLAARVGPSLSTAQTGGRVGSVLSGITAEDSGTTVVGPLRPMSMPLLERRIAIGASRLVRLAMAAWSMWLVGLALTGALVSIWLTVGVVRSGW